MPWAAMKPCPYPGCGKAIASADKFCPLHLKANTKRINRERGEDPIKRARSAFYDTANWRKCRVAFLAEFPLCRMCEAAGLIVSATVADHVIEIKQGGEPLDWSNLQPLCASCHAKKTRRDGGAW